MGNRRKFKERLDLRKSVVKDTWQRRLLSFSKLVQYWDDRTKVGKARHLRRALERYSALGISNMAATLSYYIIFALFPFAIFITWFIARFGGSLVTPEMLANFRNFVPEQVRQILSGLLDSVSTRATVAMASLGIIALLWSSSRGFSVLVYTMDLVYENPRNTATYFIQQFLSLLTTLLAGIAILLMLISMAFGSYVIAFINNLFNISLLEGTGATYLNYMISFLLLSSIFSLVYFFTSKRKKKFRFAFYCGLGCGLSWVVITFLFSLYLRSSTRYSILYGSLTASIVLMLWLYLCSTTLLIFGFVHSEILLVHERKVVTMKPGIFSKLQSTKIGPAPIGINASPHHNPNSRIAKRRKRG